MLFRILIIIPTSGKICKLLDIYFFSFTTNYRYINILITHLFKFQIKIANMESRLESARLLTYKAAALKDKKLPYTKVSGLIF